MAGLFCWTMLMVVAVALLPAARGVWLDLPTSGSKCVSEDLHSNVVVMGDYYAFIGEDYDVNGTVVPSITVKVTSPFGNNLYHKDNVSYGQFSFTTTESGNYLACFSVDGDHHKGKKASVGIDWKIGVAAKDWDSVARKEKIEGLELEFRKLEVGVEAIHEKLYNLMDREEKMWEVTETANARVAQYSVLSLGVCIVVSIFQVLYLRQYFRKKKLI